MGLNFCFSHFSPTPQITWVRINGKLEPERMESKWQKLTIYNVQYKDAGVYECRGENSIVTRAQTRKFRLEVECEYLCLVTILDWS